MLSQHLRGFVGSKDVSISHGQIFTLKMIIISIGRACNVSIEAMNFELNRSRHAA